jgi:DNA-binding CsgD family transcriptional regulator
MARVSKEARIEAVKVLISEGWSPPTPTPDIFERILDDMTYLNRRATLKPNRRERQTLALAAEGLSVPETAELMGIAKGTVSGYRKSVQRKLNARSFQHAIVIGLDSGLIRKAA